MIKVPWLQPTDPPERLPPTHSALLQPNGLLAVGGSLTPEWLVHAYRHGIFPWSTAGQPILWWSPDPRAVLFPGEFHCSRSLSRSIRNRGFDTRVDTAFDAVLHGCAQPRAGEPGTWITAEMAEAYRALHSRGLALSIETWRGPALVGGVYGVAVGGIFFAESMYSRERDASKVALARLVAECLERGVAVIDCQMPTTHLASLGARLLPRTRFETLLAHHADPELRLWRR